MGQLICGDSNELILELKDNSVDLIILDPDYQDWDKLCNDGFIDQCIRVLKKSGNIICFTKQPFDYNLRNNINHLFRREFVWTFSNGGAWVSKKMPLVSFQKLFWLTKSKEFYVNVRTGLNYNPKTKNVKRKNKVWEGYNEEGKDFNLSEEGTWIRDHYHFNKPHTGKIPSKPKELIRILINCFSPDNGIVLDPFMGSGISYIVSKELERDFIGFEIEQERINKILYNDKI